MPHGIVLLTTLKNNDNCYLLFEQPSSHHSHATSCASLPLLTTSTPLPSLFTLKLLMPKINFWQRTALVSTSAPHQSVPAPHPGCSTSHQPQKELTPLLALLLISIRGAFLTTYASLPGHLLKTLITNTSSFHTLIRSSWNSEIFYCRNGVLATNNISMARAPHQGC